MDNRKIRQHFGDERYFELRDEAFQSWLTDGKARGVSTRFYIDNYLESAYRSDMDRRSQQASEELGLVAQIIGRRCDGRCEGCKN